MRNRDGDGVEVFLAGVKRVPAKGCRRGLVETGLARKLRLMHLGLQRLAKRWTKTFGFRPPLL